MSLARRAARGTALVVVGQYASMLINFGTTIVLARLLSPSDFGVFALASSFFYFIDVTSKISPDHALMHRQDVGGKTLPTHFVLKILCSIATLMLAGIAALVLPLFGYESVVSKVLLVLAAASIVQAAGTTSWIVLEKELRFGRTMGVTVAAIILSSAFTIFLASRGFGVLSLVVGGVTNTISMTVGMWLLSPWRFWHVLFSQERAITQVQNPFRGEQIDLRPWILWLRRIFDWSIAKWYLNYGKALVLGAFATIVLLQFDNFLVGSFVGTAALGFYDRAYRLATLPTGLVTHVASRAALPVYAKVQEDRARLSFAFRATLELIASVSVPLAVVLFIAAPDVVIFLLGEAWLPSVPILRLLLGYSVMRPFLDDTGALFMAIGRPRMQSRFLMAAAAVLVLASTPLTILFGAVGTAVGVNVALAIGIAFSYSTVRREVDVPYRHILFAPLAGAFIALGVGFFLIHTIDLNELPLVIRLFIKVVVTSAVYLSVVLALEGKRLRDRTRYVWQLVLGG